MTVSLAKEIVRLALERNLLSPEDFSRLCAQAEGEGRPVTEVAVEAGLLSAALVASLATELETSPPQVSPKSFADRVMKADGQSNFSGLIEYVAPEESFPKDWGRYTLERFLGEGGMGRVFLARDPRLQRLVAIKFVRGADQDSEARFLGEAQAQARVNHDHLCKIYEVGTVEGRAYIAMEFVDGKPLNRVYKEMVPEQRIRLMKEVAEAVHEAHRMGLIHRDIKPSNIMVERTPDGGFRPVVMDFGLARQQAAPGLTVTGSVVGTPHYMPPEQARGETQSLDRRTDVYSLGASLYEILTATPPFVGMSSINVLFKVLNDEPKKLRLIDPAIPEDLETIVLKCMEKEQSKRYDSARALAEDLGRYLDGDPIQARPTSLVYRMRKKARKNRIAVTIAGIACLILLLVIGLALYREKRRDAENRKTFQFIQDIADIESRLRLNYLIPLHDISGERDVLRRRMGEIEQGLKSMGKLALGRGNYALGRGYMALNDYDNARTRLEMAWDAGYRGPDLAYARGRVMGALYQIKLRELNRIPNRIDRDNFKKEIEVAYLTEAKHHLEESSGYETESPDYVEALLAFYSGHYDLALSKAKSAQQQVGWLYEAHMLEGEIYLSRGDKSRSRGEHKLAEADFDKAQDAYRQAINIGESAPDAYNGLAELATRRMIWINDFQGDEGGKSKLDESVSEITKYFEDGLLNARKALIADPSNSESYRLQSDLYRLMGMNDTQNGRDPTENLKEAVALAKLAINRDSRDSLAMAQVGSAYFEWVYFEVDRGNDATDLIHEAERQFNKSLEIEPNYQSYNGLGYCYLLLAEMDEEPSANWDRAIDAYEKAIDLKPDAVAANGNVGLIFHEKANYDVEHGLDPMLNFEKALKHYTKALVLNPSKQDFLRNVGMVYSGIAEYHMRRGGDPAQPLEKALTYYGKVHESGRACNSIGIVYMHKMEYAWQQGLDPEKSRLMALDYFQKSVAQSTTQYAPRLNIAEVELIWSDYQLLADKSPEKSILIAFEALSDTMEVGADTIEKVPYFQALAQLVLARQAVRQGKDPAPYHLKATKFLSVQDKRFFYINGMVHFNEARWAELKNKDPIPFLESAIEDLKVACNSETAEMRYHLDLIEAYLADVIFREKAGLQYSEQLELGIFAAERFLVRAKSPKASVILGVFEWFKAGLAGDKSASMARLEKAHDLLDSVLRQSGDAHPLSLPAWLKKSYGEYLNRVNDKLRDLESRNNPVQN